MDYLVDTMKGNLTRHFIDGNAQEPYLKSTFALFMLINVLFHSVFWLKLNNFYSQWNIQIHIFMAETFPELELFLKIHVL